MGYNRAKKNEEIVSVCRFFYAASYLCYLLVQKIVHVVVMNMTLILEGLLDQEP